MSVRCAPMWRLVAVAAAMTVAFSDGSRASPVEMSSQFTPPAGKWLADGKPPADGKACAVKIDGVTDVRPDTHTMGQITDRVINIADSAGWLRSGLAALARDPRLKFVDSGDDAVALSAELVKSYIFTQTTSKSTDVVVRVRFGGLGGAPSQQIYRGSDEDANWFSSTGETESAFNRAMANLLVSLDADIAKRCGM